MATKGEVVIAKILLTILSGIVSVNVDEKHRRFEMIPEPIIAILQEAQDRTERFGSVTASFCRTDAKLGTLSRFLGQ